jgi:hypothetical protein
MAPLKPSSRRAVAVDDDEVEDNNNDIVALNAGELSMKQIKAMKDKVLAKIQEVRHLPPNSLVDQADHHPGRPWDSNRRCHQDQ